MSNGGIFALGAAMTSALFTIGKSSIGLYIGKGGTASAYGAAGSIGGDRLLALLQRTNSFNGGRDSPRFGTAAHGHRIEPEPEDVKVITPGRRTNSAYSTSSKI